MRAALQHAAVGLLLASTGALGNAQAVAAASPASAASAAVDASGSAKKSPFTLQGDKEPNEPAWQSPANVDLTRNEGKTTGTLDGYLTYKPDSWQLSKLHPGCYADTTGASLSAYWHKDTDSSSLKNDRGVELKWSATVDNSAFHVIKKTIENLCAKDGVTTDKVRDATDKLTTGKPGPGSDEMDEDRHVWNWGWSADVQLGKTLTATDTTSSPSTPKTYYDKDKNRETLTLGGYYKLNLVPTPVGGPPPHGSGYFPAVGYLQGTTGLYSDDATGGSGPTGRLSGGLAKLTLTAYPLGLETSMRIGSKPLVPSITATAQVERDFWGSGSRSKSTYRLYSGGITLAYGKGGKSDGNIIPSLTLDRSTGADLLTGRATAAKTELTFGLTF